MARAIVCDKCDRTALRPNDGVQVSRYDDQEYHAIDLCPECTPEEITELLDEVAEGAA